MRTRYRRNPSVESAPLQDETILYHPEKNKFCLLNGTAAFLWERLEQPTTEESLSADIVAQFPGVDAARAEQDVREALKQFSELTFVVAEA